MAKYKVHVQETSYYWYLVDALDEKDARDNWHEGDFMISDWDMSEFEVLEVKEVTGND